MQPPKPARCRAGPCRSRSSDRDQNRMSSSSRRIDAELDRALELSGVGEDDLQHDGPSLQWSSWSPREFDWLSATVPRTYPTASSTADDREAEQELRAEWQGHAATAPYETDCQRPPNRRGLASTGVVRDVHHLPAFCRTGRVKRKVLPRPASLSTQILPPCSSTSLRESGRPSPVPSVLLPVGCACSNSSKIVSRSAAGCPAPVSATAISTLSVVESGGDVDPAAGGRELDGVGEEVEDDLADARARRRRSDLRGFGRRARARCRLRSARSDASRPRSGAAPGARRWTARAPSARPRSWRGRARR